MGTPDREGPDYNLISEPGSRISRSQADLVTEAIRRDLLTLAGLPGQEEVGSTYFRELDGPTAA